MKRKGIIIAIILTLVLLSLGTFSLVNSLTWREKKEILLSDSFNVPANSYEQRTASISISGEYIASFNVSTEVIKFYFCDEVLFQMWQEGQFNPNWVEANHADCGMSGSSESEGESSLYHFIFLNEDSAGKEASLQVARVWKELDYIGLLSGATLVVAGIIVGVVAVDKLR